MQTYRGSFSTAQAGLHAIGTEKSKGTKVFALGGKINNTGLGGSPDGNYPA